MIKKNTFLTSRSMRVFVATLLMLALDKNGFAIDLLEPGFRSDCVAAAVFQERIEVKGMVREKNSDGITTAVANATVYVKETKVTIKADADGSFSIQMLSGQTLVFRSVSHITKEVKVIQSNPNLLVYLEPNAKVFDEVVVTGYQKIDKSKFTGSVSKVNTEIVNRSGFGDVSKMLQGAAAGVAVDNVSGTFGTTPKIRIRGSASISANQEPLYVINGVPIATPANVNVRQLYSGDPATLLSSAIAGLNANDIEDIQILKDGSATSLYGTRAANGVISITTKKGVKESMNISYSGSFSYGLKPSIDKFNLMNSQQQMDLSIDLFNLGYSSILNYPTTTGALTEAYDRYASNKLTQQGESPLLAAERLDALINRARSINTNWFDVLFKNNLFQEHSLSFSGGGKSSTYYISGSFGHDDGQAVGYDLTRMTNDTRVVLNITRNFDLDLNGNFAFRTQLSPGNYDSKNDVTTRFSVTRPFELNPALYATRTSRAMSPYDEKGNLMYYRNNYAAFNILEELRENFNTLNVLNYRFMIKPTYRISKKLTFDALLAASGSKSNNRHIATERSNVAASYREAGNDQVRSLNSFLYKDPSNPNAIPTTVLPSGGISVGTRGDASSLVVRPTLNFKSDWHHRKHVLNLFGGIELNSDKTSIVYNKVYGYQYYNGNTIFTDLLAYRRAIDLAEPLNSERYVTENRASAFFNGQYTLLDRYNFELGGRVDGNNTFGQRTLQKFLPNYSMGFSWNVDREQFYKDLNLSNTFDFLKLRASYSLRGNAYQTSPSLNAIGVGVVRRDAVNNEVGVRVLSPELYNLAWERDYIANFGLEIGLFKNVSLIAEYYRRSNRDLISESPVGFEEGFTTKTINRASVYNRGTDITVDVKDIVKTKDFSWDMNALFAYVKNRVTNIAIQSDLLAQMTNPQGFPVLGGPITGLYAYRFAGLSNTGQPTFTNGKERVDAIPRDSRDASLLEYQGPRDPTMTGSFTNTFKYKDFEFRLFFTYSFGNKTFRSPLVFRPYQDDIATGQDIDARWRSSGDEAYTNIPGLVSNIQNAYLNSAFIDNEFTYNRSNLMVVDASVLRLSELMLSYTLNKKFLAKTPWLKSARFLLSANNIYFWASPKLRGVDPQTLISGVNLPNPRSFSLRVIASF